MAPIPVLGHLAVGVDGSPGSLAALKWAAGEAELRGCPLHLLYCIDRPPVALPSEPAGADRPSRHDRGDAEELLAALVAGARRLAPQVVVSAAVAIGLARAVLIEESSRAAMVVLGAHAAGRRLGGSVSGQVAAHGECPVVVVPPDARAGWPVGPVVVGMDGSEVANLAARFAFEEAAAHRTGLAAVRALAPGAGVADVELARLVRSLSRWAQAFPEVPAEPIVVTGDPVPALARASARAPLLVVGSRGLGGVRGLLGSVSRRLLQQARCPVAVVHPHHHDAGHLRRRRAGALTG
jgi:nucleotide-binding universal stress UspA family protein